MSNAEQVCMVPVTSVNTKVRQVVCGSRKFSDAPSVHQQKGLERSPIGGSGNLANLCAILLVGAPFSVRLLHGSTCLRVRRPPMAGAR